MTTTPKVSLCPLGFMDLEPSSLIALAAGAGFDSVTLRTRAAVPGGPAYPLVPGQEMFRHAQRAIAQTGVGVQMVEQVGLARGTDIASLRPMLDGGRAIGATRVLCSGDDADHDIVAERFAALCDLAAGYGMSVDLEFMKFREVKTIDDAVAVIERAGRPNGFIVIDVLHLFRSGGTVDSVRAVPAKFISGVQLCDAPMAAPPDDAVANEARFDRLPPGEGELPISELLACLPVDTLLAVEVPLGGPRARQPAAQRAALLATSTRRLLAVHRDDASRGRRPDLP